LTASTLLRRRGLAPLLAGEVVSSLGTQMTFLALPWFVLVTTGSPARMTLVSAVQLVPIALFGIPSGGLVARLGARRTMLFGDLGRAPVLLAIPLLHQADALSFPVLLACVFVLGCFLAPYFSAQRLILPELVGDDEALVAQANAFLEGAQRAMALIGPATAGVLIGVIGATNVLYLDAATFLFAATMLGLFVPRRPPVAAGEEGRGVLAGLRYLARDPLLRAMAITSLVINAFGQMLSAALPVLAYESFGSAKVAGAFFAAFGGGAVVGTLVAMRVMPRFDPIRLAALSLVALTLPLGLLGFPLPVWGVVAVLFVSSLFGPLVNAPLIGLLTTRTPGPVRAKVMTAVLTFALLAGPVGLVVAGPLLESWGARPVFVLVAAGQLSAAAFFATVALRRPPEPAAAVADTPAL
jgi:MFS family permease